MVVFRSYLINANAEHLASQWGKKDTLWEAVRHNMLPLPAYLITPAFQCCWGCCPADLLNYCWSVFRENINLFSQETKRDSWLESLLEFTTPHADPAMKHARWKEHAFPCPSPTPV